MPALAFVRRIITWAAIGLVGAATFGVFGEWFIHIAEDKGWYAHAGQTWDGIVSGLLAVLAAPFTIYAAFSFAGLAAGMWLDFVLYRRERGPIEAAMARAEIDRQKLALEAMAIGQGVCRLAAQGNARKRVAWNKDSAKTHAGGFDGDREYVREELLTQEKYAEQYHSEVWRIIDISSRMLQISRRAVWFVEHASTSQLDEIGRLLISISNELNYPGNPAIKHPTDSEGHILSTPKQLSLPSTELGAPL